MDFQAIRKEYEDRGLEPEHLDPDPIRALAVWMEEATEQSPGRWFEPNAMALATTDLQGRVTNRLVLLKGIEAEGIQFFTNYDSLKGKQLAENPRAAVALHWPYQGRQVRIEGVTEKTDRSISEEYFHSRPVGAQLGASVSHQSSVLSSRSDLEQQKKSMAERLAGESIPLPDNWGGYWLRPDRFEFWQGRSDRLHDRVVYTIESSGNRQLMRLSP
ncbi:MAG: pyridoxamine 5'-phosphate oxidase [Planctomycetota bacterium]|nr:pyridoxamine 5'-phosphate oxidase [Planctomycetota bacterium]